jgi:F0F1-type ATP synthase assembly protein I
MSEEDTQKAQQLEALNQQLEKVKKLQPETTPAKRISSDAAKAAIDFASATAVGSGLGFAFDRWQNTMPWGLLVGLLIGVAAGTKMMLQAEKTRQKQENKKT